ncbi:MAG: hypothetical protein RR854_00140 [Muribaculaceae bacterium]
MNNQRYPFRCVVKREIPSEDFPPKPPEIKTLLRSVFGYRTDNVVSVGGGFIADYKIALQKHLVQITVGDSIEITDNVRKFNGVVKKSTIGNYGANIWFNEVK